MAGDAHRMAADLGALIEVGLDVLFPPTCIRCGTDGSWVCAVCVGKTALYHHAQTEEMPPLAGRIVCGSYADPVLQRLVTSLKYRSASCLRESMKAVLTRFRKEFREPWPWAGFSEMIVTSVPADPGRVRQRGIDHAAVIADVVRDVLVPWAGRMSLLRRKGDAVPNAKLPVNAIRKANIRGSFEANGPISVPVLLVDDVLTTGATSQEAARVLLAAGTPSVHLFTLAKGG